MHLTELELFPIHVTENNQSEVTPGVIIQLHTNTGLTGIGEVVASEKYLGDTQPHVIENLHNHWENLRGEDPADIARLHKLMTTPYTYNAAETAIDMALYDIKGKAYDEPVYRLFDRGYRSKVNMLAHVGAGSIRRARYPARRTGAQLPRFAGINVPPQDPDGPRDIHQAIDHATQYVDEGYTGLEVKIGGDPRGHDEIQTRLDLVDGIIEAVPDDIHLNFDGNASWQNPTLVISAFKHLADQSRSFVLEEPISPENPRGLVEIREALNLPILADESATSPNAVLRLITMNAIDAVIVKPSRIGGVYPALQMIAIAEAADLDIKIDTTPLTKITDTSAAHLATIPEYPYPAGLLDGHQWFKEKPFKHTGITYENGTAVLPSAPGWGIDIDQDELAALQHEPKTVLT